MKLNYLCYGIITVEVCTHMYFKFNGGRLTNKNSIKVMSTEQSMPFNKHLGTNLVFNMVYRVLV